MAKDKNQTEDPKVHEELKGFQININEFGEIRSSMNIDDINQFLNENVEDKKLKEKEKTEKEKNDNA